MTELELNDQDKKGTGASSKLKLPFIPGSKLQHWASDTH